MCANSEGSGETWAFTGRLCDKYHNLMSWLICDFATDYMSWFFRRIKHTVSCVISLTKICDINNFLFFLHSNSVKLCLKDIHTHSNFILFLVISNQKLSSSRRSRSYTITHFLYSNGTINLRIYSSVDPHTQQRFRRSWSRYSEGGMRLVGSKFNWIVTGSSLTFTKWQWWGSVSLDRSLPHHKNTQHNTSVGKLYCDDLCKNKN